MVAWVLFVHVCLCRLVLQHSNAAVLAAPLAFVNMVLCSVTIHPHGLSLQEAAKAWYLRTHQKQTWITLSLQVRNVRGKKPSLCAVRKAVKRMELSAPGSLPETKYGNCGRKPVLSREEERRIVAFVRKWCHKVFRTCRYIRQELKLSVQKDTIRRTLNKHGYFWRPVAKKSPLSTEQLGARRDFVRKFGAHTPDLWLRDVGLVFDGVTLTKAPRTMSANHSPCDTF